MNTVDTPFAHDAFISYSRKDKLFAARLERALEEFKPPRDLPVPQRHLDVFRDEGDFTGTDYFRAIDEHLAASRKLIVVCSPAARASRYVDDEIERFVRHRGAEHVIPLLLAGLPNNEAPDADDPRCAFPPALTRALAMPLAGDWRGIDPARDRVDRGGFATAWFKLLADLYGQSRAAIEQRELRRQARNRRIVIGITGTVIAALGTALVVSLVFRQRAVDSAVLAQEQRDIALKAASAERTAREAEALALDKETRARADAEASRDEAQRQEGIARREAVAARRETSERLAVQAAEQLAGRPERALALSADAIEAYRRHGDPPVPAALGAAMKVTLAFGGGLPVLPQSDARSRVQMSDDLRWAVQVDPDGNLRLGRAGGTSAQALAMPMPAPGWSWSPDRDTKLAFSALHLVAMRQARRATGDERRVHVIAWPLPSAQIPPHDPNAPSPQPLGDFELENWSGWMRPALSADGRWVAWPDGYRKVVLRALETDAAPLELTCGLYAACRFGFSPDSRWFFAYGGTEGLQRIALGTETGTDARRSPRAQRRPAIAAPRGEPAQLAVFAGERTVAGSAGGRRPTTRLAWLGQSAEVAWWDLDEDTPMRHDLPGLLEPFRSKVQLSSLDDELVTTRLEWHASGEALLVQVTHPKGEFGFAAVNAIEPQPRWQPLWHRYDGNALSTSSRLSGGAGGITGYRVTDSADLGVRQAIWVAGGAVLTLGFDGTVWFRSLDWLDANRFQLVERDASAVAQWGRWIVVGGRDGALRWWNMKRESRKPLVFNGLDAAVQEIRTAGWPTRLVAVDARGVARAWPLGHPALDGWLAGERRLVGRNPRWWITHALGEGLWLWPSEPSLAPPLRVPGSQGVGIAVAMEADGRHAQVLRRDDSGVPAGPSAVPRASTTTTTGRFRLERWRLDGSAPQHDSAADRVITLPGPVGYGGPWLVLPRERATRRAVLGAGSHGEGAQVLDLEAPAARPRPLGPPAEAWQLTGFRSNALRWLLVKTASAAGKPSRLGLVDLARPPAAAGHHEVHPLPPETRPDSARFSDDERWIVLELEGYRRCVLPLALPLQRCTVVPKDAKDETPTVRFVRDRPPLAWRAGGAALRWQAGRFVPASIPHGLTALAWDDSGSWRAEAADATRSANAPSVTLRHEGDAAVATRLPAAPPGIGTIETLFPFVREGWLFAGNGRGSLVAWHRDPRAGWQPPFVLDAETLRSERGPWEVRVLDGGRMLEVDDQLIPLDAALLLRTGRRLASGRSAEPTAPERVPER